MSRVYCLLLTSNNNGSVYVSKHVYIACLQRPDHEYRRVQGEHRGGHHHAARHHRVHHVRRRRRHVARQGNTYYYIYIFFN